MSGSGHAIDPHDEFGKKVGLQAAILAVFLSVFTICAHRAHTETILMENAASNDWAHYQAKRIRDFQLEMNTDLLRLTAPKTAETTQSLAKYAQDRADYKKELSEIKKEAEEKEHRSESAHKKASYFDLSEGVLEIALVMSSLYFLSHKKFFPVLGLIAAAGGTLAGILGFLVR